MSGSRSKKSGGKYDDPKKDDRKAEQLGNETSVIGQLSTERKRKKKRLDEIMGK